MIRAKRSDPLSTIFLLRASRMLVAISSNNFFFFFPQLVFMVVDRVKLTLLLESGRIFFRFLSLPHKSQFLGV